MHNIPFLKQQVRLKIQQLRKEKQQFHYKNLSNLLQNCMDYITSNCLTGQTIAGFWPIDNEPDVRKLLHSLYKKGYKIALPETPPKGDALSFRLWFPQVKMRVGRYKTLYPDTNRVQPDFIILPLLSFDRKGHRLGYGGGYYDRTLEKYPGIKTLGIAFSYQESASIPTEEFDQLLQVIVTEKEIIHS